MHAIVYQKPGDSNVLHYVERPMPVPSSGEVLVRLHVSGVNPTDWKSRRNGTAPLSFPEIVPHQDGSGMITAVGEGVDSSRIGERVWLFEVNYGRSTGTAAEYVAIDQSHAVRLPEGASFELGASLGIPALTAHRCLTVASNGPPRLGPGTMSGLSVLVAGGAGAVGHAAIELARWSGADVLTTVSSELKGEYSRRAGAEFVVNYHDSDAAARLRSHCKGGGVDLIVEVAPVDNAILNEKMLNNDGTIAIYASDERPLSLDIRAMMKLNARVQFVYVYSVPPAAKRAAVEDVSRALYSGALGVGDASGLPLIEFDLKETARAQEAVEHGAVGKVLVRCSEFAASDERH